jgi:hypothetical protein
MACTYFRSSSSFVQLGNLAFNKSKARQITGSPKNTKPLIKVVDLTTISALVNIETASIDITTPASLKRGASFGNGGVGDKALRNV